MSEKLSKKIAYILRHKPEEFGLEMKNDGTVSLSELIKALKTDVETVREIVASDSKGRYKIKGDRIWATQGHSVKVNVYLSMVSEPGTIYHGTKTETIRKIKEEGLQSQSRTFVHLSKDRETALSVASRRTGTSALLEIDGNALVASGHIVFESENGVLLTESVPWEFVTSVMIDTMLK